MRARYKPAGPRCLGALYWSSGRPRATAHGVAVGVARAALTPHHAPQSPRDYFEAWHSDSIIEEPFCLVARLKVILGCEVEVLVRYGLLDVFPRRVFRDIDVF